MTPEAQTFRQRVALRDALAAWRERLIARHELGPDEHYEAIMRHSYVAWNRDSSPTIPVPSRRCPRCGIAQVPLDGVCISCQRMR